MVMSLSRTKQRSEFIVDDKYIKKVWCKFINATHYCYQVKKFRTNNYLLLKRGLWEECLSYAVFQILKREGGFIHYNPINEEYWHFPRKKRPERVWTSFKCRWFVAFCLSSRRRLMRQLCYDMYQSNFPCKQNISLTIRVDCLVRVEKWLQNF